MERIDALPPEYRKLVYEYGYTIVMSLLDDCEGGWPAPDDLEFDLMMWRERKQNEALATDVITPGMLEGFKAGLRRMR